MSSPSPDAPTGAGTGQPPPPTSGGGGVPVVLRRYHGTVRLDAGRGGRDASEIADEVLSHLTGLVGAEVTVTLDIEARLPDGASEQVVRTVTENGRTLKFAEGSGFETE